MAKKILKYKVEYSNGDIEILEGVDSAEIISRIIKKAKENRLSVVFEEYYD